MKPVRRRIKSHFGLTAKQVAVRSRRPWYFQWLIATGFVFAGYLVAYWQFTGGENLRQRHALMSLDNQNLNTRLVQIERQLQIEKAAQSNFERELSVVQDDNMRLKEELLFYKNMMLEKR
jgi:hypothetical protein